MANNTITANYANDKSMQMLMAAYDNLKSMQDTIDDIHDSNDNIAVRLDNMLAAAKDMKEELEEKFGVKVDDNKPISLKNAKEKPKDIQFIDTTAVVVSNDTKSTKNKYTVGTSQNDDNEHTDKHDFMSKCIRKMNTNRNPTPESISEFEKLIAGAAEWKTPEINISNLANISSDAYEEMPNKNAYVKYHMCITDILNRECTNSGFFNIISIIAYNAAKVITPVCIDDIKRSDMLDINNPIVNSGLFIYKSSDENNRCSTLKPDGYLQLWIPKEIETSIIDTSKYKVKYNIDKSYPVLTGSILSFDSIRAILTNPKVIAQYGRAYDKGFHDAHTILLRDTKNYNLIYQDINVASHVCITNKYHI